MNILRKLRAVEPQKVFQTIEYVIVIYVSITSFLNMLTIAEIIKLDSGIMKSTFFGPSLLVLLLLQYVLLRANRSNDSLTRMRPTIMGLAAAGIVSTCSIPSSLILLVLVGYFLITGFGRKYDGKEAAFAFMAACLGIEFYSVAILMHTNGIESRMKDFMGSPWPDILLVLSAFLCYLVNRGKEEADIRKENRVGLEAADSCKENRADLEEEADSRKENRADLDAAEDLQESDLDDMKIVQDVEMADDMHAADGLEEMEIPIEDWDIEDYDYSDELDYMDDENLSQEFDTVKNMDSMSETGETIHKKASWLHTKIQALLNYFSPAIQWMHTRAKMIAGVLGSLLCVVSLGMLVYFIVVTSEGAREISESTQEVYLLRHFVDPSLVLTIGQDEDTWKVSFEKYQGTNNQKVSLRQEEDGRYQIVFLDSDYALGVDSQMTLHVVSAGDSWEQLWSWDILNSPGDNYRFWCVYGEPLYYDFNGREGSGIDVGIYTGHCEFFSVERTIGDEFVTRMVERYGNEFTPTTLAGTVIALFDEWVSLVFIGVFSLFCALIYLRRIVGDKLAALNGVLFVYLLAYGALTVIMIFFLAFGMQCFYSVVRKKARDVN